MHLKNSNFKNYSTGKNNLIFFVTKEYPLLITNFYRMILQPVQLYWTNSAREKFNGL